LLLPDTFCAKGQITGMTPWKKEIEIEIDRERKREERERTDRSP
jgi:hypothetical protein